MPEEENRVRKQCNFQFKIYFFFAHVPSSLDQSALVRRSFGVLAVILMIFNYRQLLFSGEVELALLEKKKLLWSEIHRRVGRLHVAQRYLTEGNNRQQTYLQWLFLCASEEEFRRNLRVSKAVFADLETNLNPYLQTKAKSFRRDCLSVREKIAISLFYMGSSGAFPL